MSSIHQPSSPLPGPLRDITNLTNNSSSPTKNTTGNMAPKKMKSGTPAVKKTEALPSTIKKSLPKRTGTRNDDSDDALTQPSPSTLKKIQRRRATTTTKNNNDLQAEEAPTQPPPSTTKKSQPRDKSKKRAFSEDGDELAQDPVFSTKRVRKSMPAITASSRKPATNLRSSSKAPISSSPTLHPPTNTATNPILTNETTYNPLPTNLPILPTQTPSPPPSTQNKPPFCCASSLPLDPSALYTCPNTTCLQRNAILLLQHELKTFDHAIPFASPSAIDKAGYMIQITKFIPSAADQIALLSTSRTKAVNVNTARDGEGGGGQGSDAWEVDTSAGVRGRFFVESEGVNIADVEQGEAVYLGGGGCYAGDGKVGGGRRE